MRDGGGWCHGENPAGGGIAIVEMREELIGVSADMSAGARRRIEIERAGFRRIGIPAARFRRRGVVFCGRWVLVAEALHGYVLGCIIALIRDLQIGEEIKRRRGQTAAPAFGRLGSRPCGLKVVE